MISLNKTYSSCILPVVGQANAMPNIVHMILFYCFLLLDDGLVSLFISNSLHVLLVVIGQL